MTQVLHSRWEIPKVVFASGDHDHDTSRFERVDVQGGFVEATVLGRGKYGTVIEAKELGNGEHADFAIKVLKKETGRSTQVQDVPAPANTPSEVANEIEIMKTLNHPNVMKLVDSWEDARNAYLVFPRAAGDLWDIVAQKLGAWSSEFQYARSHGTYPFLREDMLSMEAIDLLNQLLCPDPSKRLPISQIKHHPWCNGLVEKERREFDDLECACSVGIDFSPSLQIFRPAQSCGNACEFSESVVVGSYPDENHESMRCQEANEDEDDVAFSERRWARPDNTQFSPQLNEALREAADADCADDMFAGH